MGSVIRVADVTQAAELAESAARDLHATLEANAFLRSRLGVACDEIEGVIRWMTRTADLRLEVNTLERQLVERVDDLSATLARISAGLDEVDESVRRSGYALRAAADHIRSQDAHGRDQSPEPSLELAIDGLAAATALTAGSREGIDAAQRMVAQIGEQLRPTPPAQGTAGPMRTAREEIAAAARSATARQAVVETTAHHCMSLAAAIHSAHPEGFQHRLALPPGQTSGQARPQPGPRR